MHPLPLVTTVFADGATITVVVVLASALILTAALARRDGGSGGPSPRILVGVVNPRSAETLVQLAAALVRGTRGHVLPVRVIRPAAEPATVALAEETIGRADAALVDEGLDAGGFVRCDASAADGLLHAAMEREATTLLVGWPSAPGLRPDDEVLRLLRLCPCPVLVARLEGYRWRRIVLRVPREPTTSGVRASLRLATETAERLGEKLDLPITCITADEHLPADAAQLVVAPVAPDEGAVAREFAANVPPGDVVVAACHGALADRQRELTSAATRLYETVEPA